MKTISMRTPRQDRSSENLTSIKSNRSTRAITFALSVIVASLLPMSAVAQTFTNVADKGLAAAINWHGGTGPFLLQKKATLSESNWGNVLTTPNRNTTIAKDTQTGFFRLQNQTTNTVVAFTVYLDGASEVPTVATPAIAIGTLALEGS